MFEVIEHRPEPKDAPLLFGQHGSTRWAAWQDERDVLVRVIVAGHAPVWCVLPDIDALLTWVGGQGVRQ